MNDLLMQRGLIAFLVFVIKTGKRKAVFSNAFDGKRISLFCKSVGVSFPDKSRENYHLVNRFSRRAMA